MTKALAVGVWRPTLPQCERDRPGDARSRQPNLTPEDIEAIALPRPLKTIRNTPPPTASNLVVYTAEGDPILEGLTCIIRVDRRPRSFWASEGDFLSYLNEHSDRRDSPKTRAAKRSGEPARHERRNNDRAKKNRGRKMSLR